MPRNPERIRPLLERLAVVWEQHPDLRLGQLIVNAVGRDPYYDEDEFLIETIEQFYKEEPNGPSNQA